MSTACVFPGQGSQSKGMGRDLFDRFPDWAEAADEILGYSIRDLCLNDPLGQLGQTAFTQPALFVVNAMTYRAREADGAAPPAFVAGHSLGEYNALLAAGACDFDAGLRLVQHRGALMGRVTGGGMAAVIGLRPEAIEQLLAESEAGRRLDVANFNSFEQTVIAGPTDDLAAVGPAFKSAGGRVIPLKVSAPFHSRYMRAPMLEFTAFLEDAKLSAPKIPVVANLTARPYEDGRVGETLARQIDHPVRWLETVVFLVEHGVHAFEEVGPGTVLAKLIAAIRIPRHSAPAPPTV